MISWERIVNYFPKIVVKFPVTLSIVFVSFILGLILACLLAMIQIKKIPILKQLTAIFISYIRCTPIITQMFVVYFGIPIILGALGLETKNVNNIVYVYIAYALNTGGFTSEVIRSSILSVPAGQTEAGRSIGLSEFQTLIHIVVPQAIRIAMPMLGTQFILLFKGTALAYMLGVIDMMGKAKTIGAMSGHVIEGYIDCAVVFVVISLILEKVFNLIDRKFDFGKKSGYSGKVVKA